MPHAEKHARSHRGAAQRGPAAATASAPFSFEDSPRSAAQREHLGHLFGTAAQLHVDVPARQGAPLQRVVTKSTAPWGETKGKWITSLAPTEAFDTQEEAQQREDAIVEQREAQYEVDWENAAKAQAWEFADVKGRLTAHFKDGWGALYGITSYDDLRDYILDCVDRDDEELGKDLEIDLGMWLHDGEHVNRPCKIKYDAQAVISVKAGPITRNTVKRRVFHCGPTDQ